MVLYMSVKMKYEIIIIIINKLCNITYIGCCMNMYENFSWKTPNNNLHLRFLTEVQNESI